MNNLGSFCMCVKAETNAQLQLFSSRDRAVSLEIQGVLCASAVTELVISVRFSLWSILRPSVNPQLQLSSVICCKLYLYPKQCTFCFRDWDIKRITVRVCQLINLIAALNRISVSPRQCGFFFLLIIYSSVTLTVKSGSAHWVLRRFFVLNMSSAYGRTLASSWKCGRAEGGSGNKKTEITEEATWERKPYFWSCVRGATKNTVTED